MEKAFEKTFEELKPFDGFAGAIAIDNKGNMFHQDLHPSMVFAVLMARMKKFLIDMKKFIFLFLGFSSLFFSCSSDSDSQPFDLTISLMGFVPKTDYSISK